MARGIDLSRGSAQLAAVPGSLKELATKTGVDVSTLSRLRSGALRPSAAVVAKIEATLGIAAGAWFERAGPVPDHDPDLEVTADEPAEPDGAGDAWADYRLALALMRRLEARPGTSPRDLVAAAALVLRANESIRKWAADQAIENEVWRTTAEKVLALAEHAATRDAVVAAVSERLT